MIIITGPYSSKDLAVKKMRVDAIADACVNLMIKGIISVSPLIFGLALIEKSKLVMPDSYEFWQEFCRQYVMISDTVYVLNLDGWKESNGVADEIRIAKENNIPIYLVDYKTLSHISIL